MSPRLVYLLTVVATRYRPSDPTGDVLDCLAAGYRGYGPLAVADSRIAAGR